MASATQITGKTVVVAGGSRGIGLGLVQRFLERGNTVHATSRKAGAATHLQELQRKYPAGQLCISEVDTAEPGSIRSWADQLASGVRHVDVLVCNAGVYGRRLALPEFEESDFLLNFKTNAMGPFFVTQQLVRVGLLGPPGSLVANISSIMASHGDQTVSSVTGGGYAYRASKAALNAINKALAMDLGPQGVSCVVLHPGYVRTDLTGGNGWIDVDESSAGLMGVLESGQPLNGRFFSYTGEELPW